MAPNYTNAFLVSAGVLCTVILIAIWAVWGFVAALLVSYATDRLIMSRGRSAP